MLLILIILFALAAYFVVDAIMLMRNNQLSVKRSRTYAIIIALAMLGKMFFAYFTGTPIFDGEDTTPSGREYFIFAAISLAVLYTLVDMVMAILKKDAYLTEATHPDKKCKTQADFVRRKLTYFLFMVVLLFFYMDLKMM